MIWISEVTKGLSRVREIHHDPQGTSKSMHTSRFAGNTWDIPDTDRGVQWSRHNQVLCWMEAGTHHIVIVSCQDGHAWATLPVPNAYCLVIRGWEDPGIFLQQIFENQLHLLRIQGYSCNKYLIIIFIYWFSLKNNFALKENGCKRKHGKRMVELLFATIQIT